MIPNEREAASHVLRDLRIAQEPALRIGGFLGCRESFPVPGVFALADRHRRPTRRRPHADGTPVLTKRCETFHGHAGYGGRCRKVLPTRDGQARRTGRTATVLARPLKPLPGGAPLGHRPNRRPSRSLIL